MKKVAKIFLVVCLLAAVVVMAGCGKEGGNSVIKAEDGFAEGRIGDTFGTAWFEFTVISVEYPETYEEAVPADGMMFVDALIKVKNTYGDVLPMFNSDFQIQWGDGDYDFGYGNIEIPNTMPDEYSVARAETVEYHIVYEVPVGSSDFSISFLEYYEDSTEGDVFFCFFEK